MAKTDFTNPDNFVVTGYFLVVLGIGAVGILRSNRSTTAGYFLGGRTAHFLPLGLALFAANISSSQIVGLASISSAWGLAVSAYSLMSVFALLMLGWFFSPVYIASGARTLPEFLSLRYGGQRLAVFVSMFSIVLYVFTRIAVTIYSLVVFIKYTFDWNLYFTVILMVAIITAITAIGGMNSILYTSALYTPVIFVGATTLAVYAFKEVGGYGKLREGYPDAVPEKSTLFSNGSVDGCTDPPPGAFSIFRGIEDHNQPGPGTLLGVAIVMTWYWCSEQIMTQRAFAAGSLGHAKASTLIAGYLHILPLFLFVLPGMTSRVLYAGEVACADTVTCFLACENPNSCFHMAYPLLVSRILPAGVRSLLIITVMAASMSSLSAVFHSGATTFTWDIWKRLRGQTATDRELINVFRLFVLTLGFITCWWIPVVQNLNGAKLFLFIQSIYSYFSPPLLTCVLLGISWNRVNEEGAYWGLMSGLAFGIVRAAVDVTTDMDPCNKPQSGPFLLHRLHHLYFCIISLAICSVITTVISALTKPRVPAHKLAKLTWTTRHDHLVVDDVEKSKNSEDVVKDEDMDLKNQNDKHNATRKRRCQHKVNLRISSCITPEHVQERTPSIVVEKTWRWVLNGNALLLGLIASGIVGYFH